MRVAHWLRVAVFLTLCLHQSSGLAAQFVRHGDYAVHYTTFSSTLIPPDVAAAHDIERSENRIVLNISGRLFDDAQTLGVSGRVSNLLNQQFELEFEQVTESKAIYYLASHLALEQDILRFEITVTLPDGTDIPIRFVRRYD